MKYATLVEGTASYFHKVIVISSLQKSASHHLFVG